MKQWAARIGWAACLMAGACIGQEAIWIEGKEGSNYFFHNGMKVKLIHAGGFKYGVTVQMAKRRSDVSTVYVVVENTGAERASVRPEDIELWCLGDKPEQVSRNLPRRLRLPEIEGSVARNTLRRETIGPGEISQGNRFFANRMGCKTVEARWPILLNGIAGLLRFPFNSSEHGGK